MYSLWVFDENCGHRRGESLAGYRVEAADGLLGSVDRQEDAGRAHLVVDTGKWLFGRSVLVPAGLVTGVDHRSRTVTLDSTKETTKGAPRFMTDGESAEAGYLTRVEAYYLAARVPA